jgi:starch synthase (maltosyl-transferring)
MNTGAEKSQVGNRQPSRIRIERVEPEIDCGRFAAKRVPLEQLAVRADIHADGHDLLIATLLYRREGASQWRQAPMTMLSNDRWEGSFAVAEIGAYEYTIEACVDHFASWQQSFEKKVHAGQDVQVDLQIGSDLIDAAAGRAEQHDSAILHKLSKSLRNPDLPVSKRIDLALDRNIEQIVRRYPDRSAIALYDKILPLTVDPERARFSAWYEMFPRSASDAPGVHGTFADCEHRLAYIAEMGFDVLYFPPIHPIGRTNRKGRNNSTHPEPQDVGSPWAIGSEEGGHKSVNPMLGTLEDFRHLVIRAREEKIEIALDLAFQCSPDHPWLSEHPEWFRHRPDGTIQHAENPPKKYEDIVPLDFETEHWEELYRELLSVVTFWIGQGIRIFRVDNPHTKPYSLWEWMIREVKRNHPEVIFLSEAFTRPKVMHQLAKLGFSQSYTYFTWRNTGSELRQYLNDLARSPGAEYFRPNLWPNTPDILPIHLQLGGRPAFQARLVLAATLSSNYGIYGPAFELCENVPAAPGSEEYMNSEKFELRHWNRDDSESIKPLITAVNRIRRENPALQSNRNLKFHESSNEQLLAYSKRTSDFSNIVLAIVNLDFNYKQTGFIDLPIDYWKIDSSRPFQVHDLLSTKRYLWSGKRNYVELDPGKAHIFRLRRYVRTERDFDYYL